MSSIFINNLSLFEQRKIPQNEVNCTSQYHDWTTRFGQSQKRMWYEVWRNGLNHRAGQKIRRLGIRKRVIWNCSKRNWDSEFRGFVRKFTVSFLKERPKDWFYTNQCPNWNRLYPFLKIKKTRIINTMKNQYYVI